VVLYQLQAISRPYHPIEHQNLSIFPQNDATIVQKAVRKVSMKKQKCPSIKVKGWMFGVKT